MKGTSDIGDQINKKIIAPLAAANQSLNQSDFPDFNDTNKLGAGKEQTERLTNLISIFQKKELDFSKNRADGDDILGDAYEYLMRNFAVESGKSKGQFLTPAEVSMVKRWSSGLNPSEDPYNRFDGFGIPPGKQGDYAYRSQAKAAVEPLLQKWEPILGVQVDRFFVQRMKTRWGSCNSSARTIRINPELVKKPPQCLEYIVVHEMTHLLERTHNERFVAYLTQFLPAWATIRAELNRAPLAYSDWSY